VLIYREYLDKCCHSLSVSALFADHAPSKINFRYESDNCPHCGVKLKVLKRAPRQVTTLHIGGFLAEETVVHCPNCRVVLHSGELEQMVPPSCNFGYDVMIFAGRSVFLQHRTAEETLALLAEDNVRISASGVHKLAVRFITYLGIAHLEAAPALSEYFAANGGYILHLDSTSKRHSRKLLSGIDEVSGFVLLNVKISTETGQDIAAFLHEIVFRYDRPIAVACDMAAAIRCGLRQVLPGVPVFICHFHFLRDAGKDLMEKDYRLFSSALDRHDIAGKMREMQSQLEPHIRSNAALIEQFLAKIDSGTLTDEASCMDIACEAYLGALVSSAVEAERQGDGLGFPFDRPNFDYYNNLLTIHDAVCVLRDCLTPDHHQQKLFDRVLKALGAVRQDDALSTLAKRIQRNIDIFDELRSAMRIAEPNSTAGLNDQGATASITSIERAVQQFRDRLEHTRFATGRLELDKLAEQLDRHWHGLFRQPILVASADGGERIIQPQRTNNILEQFFRDIGRRERRRTGTNLSARRLNAMSPHTPLARNLNEPIYYDILLDGAGSLEERFARIDASAVRDSIEQARTSGQIFAKPRKARKVLLQPTTTLLFAKEALRLAIARIDKRLR